MVVHVVIDGEYNDHLLVYCSSLDIEFHLLVYWLTSLIMYIAFDAYNIGANVIR